MKYIAIDYRNRQVEQPYLYLLELDDCGMVERQLAIDTHGTVAHRIKASNPSGDFRWETHRFSEVEIAENLSSKSDFDRFWA